MTRLGALTQTGGGHVSAEEASHMLNEVRTLRRLLRAAASEKYSKDTDWGSEARELLGVRG